MSGNPSPVFIAVVHSLDGVRFVTTGHSREAVETRIAGYVGERCGDVLPADTGGRVRAMLAAGDLNRAIAAYFQWVGKRWDDERLERFTAEADGVRWTLDEAILSDARR